MANLKFPFGRYAVTYYSTSGKKLGDSGLETPALWLADGDTTEAGEIRNQTLNLASTRADTNTRAATSGGFMSETPVLKGGEVTFDTPWDLSEAFVKELIAKWSAEPQDRLTLAFLNRDKDTGLVTGDIVNGFIGNMFIELNKDENPDDIQRANWTATHADSGQWYEVVTA